MYYLQYEKNVSPKTIENYSLRLSRFLEFCGDVEISKINRMQLLDYRDGITQKQIERKNYQLSYRRYQSIFEIRTEK